MRHSITEPMPPRPTDGGRSASLGQRAAENESSPQAAAKKHASGKPDPPERSRQHTTNPHRAPPTSARGRCRSPAIRTRGLQRRACEREPLLDVQRLPRAQRAGNVRPAKAREQLLGADIASLRAVLLDIPASRASTSLSASASMLSTSSSARSMPCSGIDGFLDALGANLGEPQFEGLGLRRRNRLDDAEDTVSCRVCNAPIS